MQPCCLVSKSVRECRLLTQNLSATRPFLFESQEIHFNLSCNMLRWYKKRHCDLLKRWLTTPSWWTPMLGELFTCHLWAMGRAAQSWSWSLWAQSPTKSREHHLQFSMMPRRQQRQDPLRRMSLVYIWKENMSACTSGVNVCARATDFCTCSINQICLSSGDGVTDINLMNHKLFISYLWHGDPKINISNAVDRDSNTFILTYFSSIGIPFDDRFLDQGYNWFVVELNQHEFEMVQSVTIVERTGERRVQNCWIIHDGHVMLNTACRCR